MALKKIFCPDCGSQTQVNDEKEFCFCLECGYKIPLQSGSSLDEGAQTKGHEDKSMQDNDTMENDHLAADEKLKEVEFYYQLSRDKKEYEKPEEEPGYYLKAQDLLVDLSQQYPQDYRIWWELSKPLDFMRVSPNATMPNQCGINENYFGRALDLAGIEDKKRLIDAHDKYVTEKKAALALEEKAREIEEQEKRRQIEIERQRYEEERKRREESEARKAAEKIRREQEEQAQKEAAAQEGMRLSAELWKCLEAKDYSVVNARYFRLSEGEQTIIGIFRTVSNVLYLMSFRMEQGKNHVIYRDQTVSVKFDKEGYALKYDNRPLKIKGMMPPNDRLRVVNNGLGGYSVNHMELLQDDDFVNNILKDSKKPFISFNKTFL